MRARRSIRTGLYAAVTMLALSGCGESALSPSDEVARLQALARWTAQGLVQYTVETRVSCFCPVELNQWQRITVAGNVVTAVVPVDSSGESGSPVLTWYSSVDELFARIATAGSATDGSRVSAEYDAVTGLPTVVSFEAPPGVLDGGAVYYYRKLRPAPVYR